jgi:predicted RNase H-like HicB family nuclease
MINTLRGNCQMKNKYTILMEQGEDGYLISEVIELPGCHTQAKTYNELLERTKEAISLYLEEKKDFIPEAKFIGLHQVEV